jgi:hypothetical protein
MTASTVLNAPDSRALWMTAEHGAGCLGILRTLRAWARHGELKAAAGAGCDKHRPIVSQPKGFPNGSR